MIPRSRVLALCLLAACRSAQPLEGLAPARETGGPRVVLDLTRKPLPEMPFPNDLATRPDPSSPTGLRINASLAAPSQLEQRTRALLDQLDGFGTYAPITVSFEADLDVADLFARQNNGDPADDGVYLVQIDDGSVWPLDFGAGRFPSVIADPAQYFPGDPFARHRNLLFPGCGPGANVLVPPGPACDDPDPRRQADQLLSFYERETRTLVMRPVVPLRQEKRYAAILTDRVRDAQGRAVVPPGAGINHPAQTGELRPVLGRLPPGAPLERIAYAWAFTTQSITRDLESIRLGLQPRFLGFSGSGPFSGLAIQYPAQLPPPVPRANARTLLAVLPARDGFPLTDRQAYIVPASEVAALLQDPALQDPAAARLFGDLLRPAALPALVATFKYVDYFVSASFTSPSLIGVPAGAPEDGTFQLSLASGQVHAQPETVTFLLAVPKRNGTHLPPFPTVIVGHGYTGTRSPDLLAFAGTFAKFGLASISIDAFGHGLDPAAVSAIVPVFQRHGLDRFAQALLKTRARDLDNDGQLDSGADFWSADAFHTRDAVRQSVVDWMMLVQILRSFDGASDIVQTGPVQFLAGDFNNDGIPDVSAAPIWQGGVPNAAGGTFPVGALNPGRDVFVFGVSLGGILGGILPAVEPAVRAAAPVSGGGGLSDVALRTQLSQVVNSVFLGTMGPFFTICDYSPSLQRCAPGQPQTEPRLVMVVQDLNRERDLPVAMLALAPGDKLTLRNLSHGGTDATCARDHTCATATLDAAGKIRVAVTADGGDRLQLSVLRSTGSEPQNINTFEFDASFHGVAYRAGDPLTAPVRGYGYGRNTPDFRRLIGLSQMILDPGDPINYAPHWFGDLLPSVRSIPAPALVIGTAGDSAVPIGTAVAMARAAGIVGMSQPDPVYGVPVDQVLLQAAAVEGVANLRRLADAFSGPRAALGARLRCNPPADCSGDVLVDPTAYSLDTSTGSYTDGLNAPRLDPPLREQLQRGVPLGDGTQATAALLLPYMSRTGQHGFRNPQPDKPFDMDQFLANLIGRWFETRGRELHFERCQTTLATCPWILSPPP